MSDYCRGQMTTVNYVILKIKLTSSGECDFFYVRSLLTVAHRYKLYISKLQSNGHFYVASFFLSPHTFGISRCITAWVSLSQSLFFPSLLPLYSRPVQQLLTLVSEQDVDRMSVCHVCIEVGVMSLYWGRACGLTCLPEPPNYLEMTNCS